MIQTIPSFFYRSLHISSDDLALICNLRGQIAGFMPIFLIFRLFLIVNDNDSYYIFVHHLG